MSVLHRIQEPTDINHLTTPKQMSILAHSMKNIHFFLRCHFEHFFGLFSNQCHLPFPKLQCVTINEFTLVRLSCLLGQGKKLWHCALSLLWSNLLSISSALCRCTSTLAINTRNSLKGRGEGWLLFYSQETSFR